jgi:hypothetical protein
MAKVYAGNHSIYTDQITAVGSVRRVHFRMLVRFQDDITGVESFEWHYYGTTLLQHPLTEYPEFMRNYPTFEHTYISFPQDVDNLGWEANDYYFQLGILAGLRREGLVI